jgi:phage shock protein A
MSLFIRSFALARGLGSSVLSWFERRNPEILLENERENLRKLIGQFNTGLVTHAAVWERLITQVSKGENEAAELGANINASLRAADRTSAAKWALELKQVNARLEADRKQLVASEQTYNQLVRRRDAAVAETRDRIETVRRQIGDLKVKRAVADLEGMANAMIGTLGTQGDSLARLQELVTEERETASARARVAGGAFDPELEHARENLRVVLAEDALAAFLAEQEAAAQKALPDYSNEIDSTVSKTNRKEKIQ